MSKKNILKLMTITSKAVSTWMPANAAVYRASQVKRLKQKSLGVEVLRKSKSIKVVVGTVKVMMIAVAKAGREKM